MADNDEDMPSITGRLESAEPAAASASSAPQTAAASSTTSRPPASGADNGPSIPSSAKHHPLHGPRSLVASGSGSTANSPLSSRDSSPHRQQQQHHQQQHSTRQIASAQPKPKSGLRSRKSSTDVSPSRGPALAGSSTTTVPSAAAIQRALSAASIPNLPPSSAQDPSRVPRPAKASSGTNSGDTTPHWPISPRLKSPPPEESRSRSRRNSLRTQQTNKKTASPGASTPSIVVQSSSPASTPRVLVKDEANSDSEDMPILTMKGSGRGTSGVAPKLETVQEASLPTTPGFDELEAESGAHKSQSSTFTDESRNDVSTAKITEDLSASGSRNTESGSDSGTTRKDRKPKSPEKRSASSQRPAMTSKSSYSSLGTMKSRSEPQTTNMTVETETVPSIPQAPIGGNQDRSVSGRMDASGSVRLKPSTETIRPKREKQKPKRKAPSINSGTASSKADVFEAKVASAVDEANSSDSDETFVYESNPPDPQPHRSRQHHSRTPSMTSITSLADPRTAIRDTHKIAAKKSSMKFASNFTNPHSEDGGDRPEGTMRSSRTAGGTHHHHIGRHGQVRGGLAQAQLLSGDSSGPQSSKTRVISSRGPSQPTSPRFHSVRAQNGNGNGSGRKTGEYSMYDMDSAGAADDERTPLVATIRGPRGRGPRRPESASLRRFEQPLPRRRGCCRRFTGSLVFSVILFVLVVIIAGLVYGTTKPMYSVKVREIQNVIASQEELMLDLLVDAVNPNLIGITVADMDVNIFAKSKHVGSDKWWREHGRHRPNQEKWHSITDSSAESEEAESGLVHAADGVDKGTDPIEEPPEAGEPRTMLLGRIFHFDSPLSFDGTFFNHQSVESLGELRLTKPGNKTEAGGTERWEEVLQYPFELILRGVFKYQLPLNARERTIPITASYHYDPDQEKKKLQGLTASTESGHVVARTVKIFKPWGRWDVRGRFSLSR